MKVLSSIGLVFDMIGAVLLVWGTMRRLATWFRSQGVGPESQQARWYDRIAVRVSTYLFGSSDLYQVSKGDPKMQETSAIFWALIFLLVGFALQLFGTLLTQ